MHAHVQKMQNKGAQALCLCCTPKKKILLFAKKKIYLSCLSCEYQSAVRIEAWVSIPCNRATACVHRVAMLRKKIIHFLFCDSIPCSRATACVHRVAMLRFFLFLFYFVTAFPIASPLLVYTELQCCGKCMCVCMYICMHACVCVCVRTHTHTDTHTHTHTHAAG